MGRIVSFRELRVYRAAFTAAQRIFELSKGWPATEERGLTRQIRRSSRSVCGNIGEAWRKRRYPAAFVAKLSDAEAEAAETRVWLDFALAYGYVTREQYRSLDREYDRILAQLVRMIHRADHWAVGAPRKGGRPRKRPPPSPPPVSRSGGSRRGGDAPATTLHPAAPPRHEENAGDSSAAASPAEP